MPLTFAVDIVTEEVPVFFTDKVITELTGAGSEVRYIPVPYRCILHSVRIASDLQMDATGTLTFSRGADIVNLVTVPAGNIAAGTILDGVPDATNEYLIFDPESTTPANQVIKLTDDATLLAGAASVTIQLEVDDSCYIESVPLEA